MSSDLKVAKVSLEAKARRNNGFHTVGLSSIDRLTTRTCFTMQLRELMSQFGRSLCLASVATPRIGSHRNQMKWGRWFSHVNLRSYRWRRLVYDCVRNPLYKRSPQPQNPQEAPDSLVQWGLKGPGGLLNRGSCHPYDVKAAD